MKVPPDRVLGPRSFAHDPGFLQAVLGARSLFWLRLQDVTEEVHTGDAEASVSDRLGWGGCAVSVPPYLAAAAEQGTASEHPIQDASKGPDVYLVGFRGRGVLHFGRHIALCADAGP